jgi:hypothetical protein
MAKYQQQPVPPEYIVQHIGVPTHGEPYVNPAFPTVPTGATEEWWACGCRATPAGLEGVRLTWHQCPGHRELDVAAITAEEPASLWRRGDSNS